MASISTSKLKIERFDGTGDFAIWRMKMLALLGNMGLDEALEGEDALPEKWTANKKKEVLKKAYNTLILSLSDKVCRQISYEKTTEEVWSKLDTLYMKKTLSNRLYLKEKFFTFKMVESIRLQDHIDEFVKLCNDLENIQIKYDDEDKAMVLLQSLPKSYENFVDILKHGRESLSLDYVISALNSKDLQMEKENGKATGSALNVQGKGQNKGKGKSKSNKKSQKKKEIVC